MTTQNFVQEWNNKLVKSPHGILGQCVSVSSQWAVENGWPELFGAGDDTAYHIWLNGVSGYTKVLNAPLNFPNPGDIFFFNASYGSGDGHTGVVIAADVNSVTLFEQNDPDGSPAHEKVYNYNGAAGWFQAPNQGEDMIIQNAPNWFARCQKTMQMIRGRDLGQNEFETGAVGAEFMHWVEAVEDNPEADAAHNAMTTGQVALRDNWQGQINTLTEELKQLQSPTTLAPGVYKVN